MWNTSLLQIINLSKGALLLAVAKSIYYIIFREKGTPFIYLCILFYILQSVKCLPFYIPKALKRYPFQGEPPHIVYRKDSPPLVLGERRQKLSLNCSDFLGELLVVCSTRRFIAFIQCETSHKIP